MKTARKITSLILCCCILLGMAASLALPRALATAADDLEDSMLGTLSEIYESNGNPGAIAQVAGDTGGKSYGLYMFTSAADVPKAFFEWCQASSNAYYQGIGNTLSEAYYSGGSPGYGPMFDQAWRSLAADNAAGFGRAQRDFVRATFYNKYVAAIAQKAPGFDISNYSIALRNVLWSRAVQHGVGGATKVFTRAMETLGGFTNQPESELINAIYNESGRLTTDGKIKMHGAAARRYGVEGKSLAYFSSCSSDVQLGVYCRLRINEPAKAQAMLAEYGYGDAPLGEGNYLICPVNNDNLAVTPDASGLTINTLSGEDSQQFHLVYYASGCYVIASYDGSKRLTAGSSLSMADPKADNSQFWSLVPLNSGFALQNRATGQYLSASSFSAGGAVIADDAAVQWQLVPGSAHWSLTGASYPTYANGLQVGSSSYPFRGILRSTYTITKVRAEVQNSAGQVMFFAEATPTALYYDLSRMDNSMTFSRLGSGSYTLIITATDTSGSNFALNEPFFVTGDVYTAVFDAAGGTCSVSSMTFTPGQVLGELPVPTKTGMAFEGWYDEDGNLFTGASVTPAHDLILTAHYSKLYTYTFFDYDGKTVLSTGQLKEKETIPQPKDPSRAATDQYYYTFSGWRGYTPGMVMPANDVSFTAQYDEHEVEQFTEIVASGSYHLVDGYLRVIPIGTTAKEILDTLTPREYITIHKGSQEITGVVGTGMTVDFIKDGKLIQSAAIVVTGDVNGDGKLTLTDMVQIRSHLLGRSTLTDAYAQAADLNGDGQLTLTDFVQCLSAVLGRSSIKPN